jgi:o-succinylbenzoate---CoA ligase
MNKQHDTLSILQQQTQNNWLINYDNLFLLQLTQELCCELTNFRATYQITPIVLLLETDPLKFIASFLAAIISKVPIFLGNPHWQETEYQQVKKLLKPNIIWNEKNYRQSFNSLNRPLIKDLKQDNLIGIPTGGSSGKIRFALHTTATLTASVKGFTQYFETDSVNSCCMLPLYHVSGLMQFWRSLITQGNLTIISYQNLKHKIKPKIEPQNYFLSLVPTQLQFLLDSDSEWLRQFKTILLGGAPTSRSLLKKARQFQIPVATTYGMTETASGITYLKPQDFLSGNDSSGRVLPHAKVTIIERKSEYSEHSEHLVGTLKIAADSLFYGYYPEYSHQQQPLISDDLGFFDESGFLHIVGRNSQKIITGGENVYPQEIEAAILATKLVKDVCVIGLEDAKWGQVVTALFISWHDEVKTDTILQQLQPKLGKHKLPKHWLQVNSLPRDAKGKINYSQLTDIARNLLGIK